MLKSTLYKINQIKKLSKEYIDANIEIDGSYRSPSWHLFQDELIEQHPELESVLYRHAYPLLNYFHEYRENSRDVLKKKRHTSLVETVEEECAMYVAPEELIKELIQWCEEKNADPCAISNVISDLEKNYERKILWKYTPEYSDIKYDFVLFFRDLLVKYKIEDNTERSQLCRYLWHKIGSRYVL